MLGSVVGLARIAVAEVLRNWADNTWCMKIEMTSTDDVVLDVPREDSAPDLLFEWTKLIPA